VVALGLVLVVEGVRLHLQEHHHRHQGGLLHLQELLHLGLRLHLQGLLLLLLGRLLHLLLVAALVAEVLAAVAALVLFHFLQLWL
jgi:Flp pilus assembly protein TadB